MTTSAVLLRSLRTVGRAGITLAFLSAFCVEPAYAALTVRILDEQGQALVTDDRGRGLRRQRLGDRKGVW